MGDLRVQLKKGRDGPPSLTAIRPDGSRTWSRVHRFFPLHDLLHYTVETTLGFREAFFGLLAAGWALDDFTAPHARARLPAEAGWAENIVGLLDQERARGGEYDAETFNAGLGAALVDQGWPPWRELAEAELVAIRRAHRELAARWQALAPGEQLELIFAASASPVRPTRSD
ncbi:MAG TPA: hypothetical protein VFW66_10475 [Gemmatimonadales bacterium]|nr:hypothetical protein [Gemmatimonadales bacterium]